MKKALLFVILLSVVAFSGRTQNIRILTPGGSDITNATITQRGTPDSIELITYLHVKNNGTQTINVYSKKIEVSKMDSTDVYMCWAGGCYTPGTFISPSAASINAGQTLTDFSGHYTTFSDSLGNPFHFKPGESVIRWVFFNADNPNDSSYVTVKYVTYPLGVEEKAGQLSAIGPNPANDHTAFNCNISSGSQGTIIIRNLLGETVYTESIASGNHKVTVSTAALNEGIYFCTLLVNGKPGQTKKMVVKH